MGGASPSCPWGADIDKIPSYLMYGGADANNDDLSAMWEAWRNKCLVCAQLGCSTRNHDAGAPPPFRFAGTGSSTSSTSPIPSQIPHLAALLVRD